MTDIPSRHAAFTFVNSNTDPCLAAFTDEMRARRINAERDENGPNMFKDPRIETMWEGFVCE
jgi:hypothetical protein